MARQYDGNKTKVAEDTIRSRPYNKNEIAMGMLEYKLNALRKDNLGNGWEEVENHIEDAPNGQKVVVLKRAKYEYR